VKNVLRAFDEAAFGRTRTLNLRSTLPTAREATDRLDVWLREQQVARAGSVLVITGRGNNSPDGISAVREAALRAFPGLRRRGVITGWREHTPGSFVVELAPLSALFERLPRKREPRQEPVRDPAALAALSPAVRSALRRLAVRSLENLGVREPQKFVEEEMLRQFALLSAALSAGEDHEARLMSAITGALEELDA
jgi:hypothetical protein